MDEISKDVDSLREKMAGIGATIPDESWDQETQTYPRLLLMKKHLEKYMKEIDIWDERPAHIVGWSRVEREEEEAAAED